MRYAEEWIEQVRHEADILQVVSEHVALHKKGHRYWGLCPFHGEKTPSFSVVPDKGFYYCFGCQSGGNVFQFLMQVEQISFGEAARKIAQQFGIPLPEMEKNSEEERREREQKALRQVNEQGKQYFEACLNHEKIGLKARAYLAKRGIDTHLQEKFMLGFAPNAWQHLTEALLKKGISPEQIEASGLAGKNQRGRLYERFRDRLMFPIADPRGRIVGFGGRLLEDKAEEAKYLNTPETVLFNKRHLLYGLNLAVEEIKKTKSVFVVEGYMDLIALHKAGIFHAVASLGTAFTPQQARLLQRLAEEVVFAYDSDAAGQNATLRALQIVSDQGMRVRILDLPDGKDPDEYIRVHGVDAFLKLEKKSILEYRMKRILESGMGAHQEDRQKTVQEAVRILAETEDSLAVEEQIRRMSSQMQMDEGVLRQEIRRYRRRSGEPEKRMEWKSAEKIETPVARSERRLLYLLGTEDSIRNYVKTQLSAEDFSDPVRSVLYQRLLLLEKEETLVLSAIEEEESREWYRIEGAGDFFIGDLVTDVDGLILQIRLYSLNQQLKESTERVSQLLKEGNEKYLQENEKSKRILQEIELLKAERRENL